MSDILWANARTRDRSAEAATLYRRHSTYQLSGGYHWIEEGPSQNGDHSRASYSPMRIELNYQAETLEEAICQTIVAYLRKVMAPRELLDQLIEMGFVRNPGNNALEVVVQRLGEMAEQMHHDRTCASSPSPE